VAEEFGMPRCPVRAAVAVLERHTGRGLFDLSAPSARSAGH